MILNINIYTCICQFHSGTMLVSSIFFYLVAWKPCVKLSCHLSCAAVATRWKHAYHKKKINLFLSRLSAWHGSRVSNWAVTWAVLQSRLDENTLIIKKINLFLSRLSAWHGSRVSNWAVTWAVLQSRLDENTLIIKKKLLEELKNL